MLRRTRIEIAGYYHIINGVVIVTRALYFKLFKQAVFAVIKRSRG
jgi:hypothetical protein